MVPTTQVSFLQSYHTKSPGIFHCLPGVHWGFSAPRFLHLLTGPLKKVQSFSNQAACSLFTLGAHSSLRVIPRCLVQSQKPSPGAGHHYSANGGDPKGPRWGRGVDINRSLNSTAAPYITPNGS